LLNTCGYPEEEIRHSIEKREEEKEAIYLPKVQEGKEETMHTREQEGKEEIIYTKYGNLFLLPKIMVIYLYHLNQYMNYLLKYA
jgi:hypothetical protein